MSKTAFQRLMALSIHDADSGCRLWLGSKNHAGYGWFFLNGKRVGAHRASFEIHHGPVPPGLDVCHRCDTPSCIAEEHLFAGTRQDNVRDMYAKGRQRHACGDAHPSAKLTWGKVEEIRSDRRAQRAIAADHGVSHQVVGAIKNGKMWKRPPEQYRGGSNGVA